MAMNIAKASIERTYSAICEPLPRLTRAGD
jgi:hypothetical protein